MTEKTKYKAGDFFIRNYNGLDHLCILLSKDLDKGMNRDVWVSTMNPLYSEKNRTLFGGGTVIYFEEDIDKYKIVGNVAHLVAHLIDN